MRLKNDITLVERCKTKIRCDMGESKNFEEGIMVDHGWTPPRIDTQPFHFPNDNLLYNDVNITDK